MMITELVPKRRPTSFPKHVGLSSPAQQILCAARNIPLPITPRKLRRVPPERMGGLLWLLAQLQKKEQPVTHANVSVAKRSLWHQCRLRRLRSCAAQKPARCPDSVLPDGRAGVTPLRSTPVYLFRATGTCSTLAGIAVPIGFLGE